ncbi:MAG: ribosomal protein S18 acetylase RimI-like enzyme [Phenylobacterium sp.]|jgi:ribosomal protein S18 acetylase RimI-like enzyme
MIDSSVESVDFDQEPEVMARYQGKTFQIGPLSEEHLVCAASLLFQSYHDDPLFMEIFDADKVDYDKRLRTAIRAEIFGFWQAKKDGAIGLFIDNQLLGVACVVCPQTSGMSGKGGVSVGRFWHWRLKMLLTAGFFSTRQMMEKEEKLRAAMPSARHHMLAFLAIHPKHQQHGLGNHLLKAVDDIVSQDPTSGGIGVYVTLDKYLHFFNGDNYDKIADVSVGYVHGQLLFRPQVSQDLQG